MCVYVTANTYVYTYIYTNTIHIHGKPDDIARPAHVICPHSEIQLFKTHYDCRLTVGPLFPSSWAKPLVS